MTLDKMLIAFRAFARVQRKLIFNVASLTNMNTSPRRAFRNCRFKSLFALLSVTALFYVSTAMSTFADITITISPSTVCPGDTITVDVDEDCDGSLNENLTKKTGPALSNFQCVYDDEDLGIASYEGTYVAKNSDAGSTLNWSFSDDCYGETSAATGVTVVGADSVAISPDYADNWTGNTITYTVKTIPAGVTCPDTITWTGDVTSGATGTTTTKSYTDTGSKTATAHVGTSTAAGTLTIHKLVSTCDADCPTPKVGRTDLGLGETVILTIEPAATPFAWSLINGGHSSISGGSFTASQTGGESPTVQCQLADAGGPIGTWAYNTKAPTGINYFGTLISPLPPYDQTILAPPNNHIGYGLGFVGRVTPASVSFAKARIREHLATQTHTFPDGITTLTSEAADITLLFGDCSVGINVYSDGVGMGLEPYSALQKGGVMTADSYTRNCPIQYEDADNNWDEVVSGSSCAHIYSWSTSGVTTITVTPGSVSPKSGGPWR
jgi:hypothetical protein